ncbi:SHOCT domain-containing protein [Agromyces sp. S2-1-8]|uniref:SHOCT domain-containing protein n=1 Tax=Agromyces sp. S2-1-8 TaxID=2897180 RepID=UPI001E4F3E50|nr:SHOCT domain-containing protein [Agromyces sp. S2-1-8]MCD5346109.1 SHOCT domain-containing protein [Agromyces sp. S2-1-8]
MDDPFNPPVEIDPFAGAPAGFQVMFVLVALVGAAVFLITIITVARSYMKVREAGHDPLTIQAELATRTLDSELLAPKQSIEQRLAELDGLAARGLISDAERAAARADILAGR